MAQDTFILNDVKITNQNFTGKKSMFNRSGNPNFIVKLDNYIAKNMKDNGFYVKMANEQAFLMVIIDFKVKPVPTITRIIPDGRLEFNADDLYKLEFYHHSNVNIVIRAQPWTVGNVFGNKAYLESLTFT